MVFEIQWIGKKKHFFSVLDGDFKVLLSTLALQAGRKVSPQKEAGNQRVECSSVPSQRCAILSQWTP
jgi:hypothetical protein